MRLGTSMPSLAGATEWLNGEGEPVLTEGKVTLVHFWAVSCHICHETMPEVMRIVEQYKGHGLQTVAIHMPRYEEDADKDKVLKDMADYGMTQRIGLDHRMVISGRFENEYVPAFFVFGEDGTLKFRAAGDRGFQKVEPKICEALGLPVQV
ncbi:MAG: thiol-disulfide oxidoreductase [Alicyclobacillus sp. RIFOXYA1_FULL_53_8]|nr:MAG: thiol-disulfide oxidoreductase [Alicyclobacillus sp. RIFOXYA1_FULL_53_8]